MNKLKYIFLLIAGAFMFASCSDSPTLAEKIESTTNLAGFPNRSMSVARIDADSSYQIKVPIEVFGPSVRDLSGDVTVTVEMFYSGIPEAERAEQGVHLKLNSNKVTLTESDTLNYSGFYTFTMLTKNVTAPLKNSPSFKLKTTAVSADGNVVNSAKDIKITLNYACPSYLTGIYNVVAKAGGTTYKHKGVRVTRLEGIGQYVTTSVGGFWSTKGSPYRPTVVKFGVKFSDVCGTLTVNSTILGGTFGNNVTPDGETQVNGNSEKKGSVKSFKLKYNVEGLGAYTATYTYVKPLPKK